MIAFFGTLLHFFLKAFRSRGNILTENALLKKENEILTRKMGKKRVHFDFYDKLFLVVLNGAADIKRRAMWAAPSLLQAGSVTDGKSPQYGIESCERRIFLQDAGRAVRGDEDPLTRQTRNWQDASSSDGRGGFLVSNESCTKVRVVSVMVRAGSGFAASYARFVRIYHAEVVLYLQLNT